MKPHIFEFQTALYRPLSEVFEFFSHAENLNQITPTTLSFSILTPTPIPTKAGTLIDYYIKLKGIPFFWRTMITDWEPPYRFVDQQLKGPYVFWHHEHTFVEKDDHVLMTDRVTYLSPGLVFEPLLDKLFIRPEIEKIWAFRAERFKVLFGKDIK